MKTKLQTQEKNKNVFANQLTKLFLVLSLCISSFAFAQPGALDATFVSGTAASTGNVASSVVQSDGKVVIGGTFTSYNGTAVNRICRVNTNGSIDCNVQCGNWC